jgi:hypothetical protein
MDRVQDNSILHPEKVLRRKLALSVMVSTCVFPTLSSHAKTKNMNPYNEKRVLQQNKNIQKQNNAPDDFPNFIREGNDHCFFIHDYVINKKKFVTFLPCDVSPVSVTVVLCQTFGYDVLVC